MSDGMRTSPAAGLFLVLGILAAILMEVWFFGNPVSPHFTSSDLRRQEKAEKVAEAKEMKAKISLKAVKPSEMPSVEPQLPGGQGPKPEGRRPYEVDMHRGLIDLGKRWLEQRDGAFPALIAHYQAGLGFRVYAHDMQKLGGRFFVRDIGARKLLAEIDLRRDRLIPVDIGSLSSLSVRSRDLSDEPQLRRFIQQAQRIYGPARYGILLLVPVSVDALVMGGIEEGLRKLGRSPEEFLTVEGQYRRRDDNLILVILSGRTRSGRTVRLNLVLDLGKTS